MKKLLIFLVLTYVVFSAPIYVEPPIAFKNTPLKIAIETVFLKANVQYSVDVDLGTYGNVTIDINEKTDIGTILTLLLDPKGLTFEKEGSIYRVQKNQKKEEKYKPAKLWVITDVTSKPEVLTVKKKEEGKVHSVYVKPFSFPESSTGTLIGTLDLSLKAVLEVVFLKAGVRYTIDVKDIQIQDFYTLHFAEKHELDYVLNLVLGPENFEFAVDANGIYHIKKIKENGKAPPIYIEPFNLLEPPIDFLNSNQRGAPIAVTGRSMNEENQLEVYSQARDGGLEQNYVSPPLEFLNAPIRIVLESIFKKAGRQSIKFYGESDYMVTYSLKEKMPLNSLLQDILQNTNVTMENRNGAIYLKQNGKEVMTFNESFQFGNQSLEKALKTIMDKFNYEFSVYLSVTEMKVINVKIEKGAEFDRFLADFLWNYELTYSKDKTSKYLIRKLTDEEIAHYGMYRGGFIYKEKYKGVKFDEEIYFEKGKTFTGTLAQSLKNIFVNNGIPYGWSEDEKKTNGTKKVNYTVTEKESMKDVLQKLLKGYNLKYLIDQNGKVCICDKNEEFRLITRRYSLTYADAEDYCRRMKKSVLTQNGSCEVDIDTNTLIITDVEEVFEGIENLLKESD